MGSINAQERKEMADEYKIEQLIDREVYVGGKLVGTVRGQRFNPRPDHVRSLRLDVMPEVADEYMRKPAFSAPLAKELIHSLQPDGTIRISKSMRELQRRWRNTIRIEEGLYAPDEMLGRAVMDNDSNEIGTVVDLQKVKRTFKGAVVKLLPRVSSRMGLPEEIMIPVDQFSKTTARLDEVILSSTLERVVALTSYAKLNGLEVEE
ncbi:MAG TPA: hypothetical protein HA330_01945 [Candidatus Thalassarchaeaceae archaeon]|nr:MAG TPA: hypothetical protein D7H85_01955 [Candidatus Poseidoniales archaeon]HII48627.1 hypothetical protein [Candidatus Thalassarchaeaceae archaeon]